MKITLTFSAAHDVPYVAVPAFVPSRLWLQQVLLSHAVLHTPGWHVGGLLRVSPHGRAAGSEATWFCDFDIVAK